MADEKPYREWQCRVLDRIVIDSATDCWLWSGGLDTHGYGVMSLSKYKRMRAHRAAYAAFRGEIAEGLELDHLCRRRNCVNPWHLEPVTRAENARRGKMAKLTYADVAVIRSLNEPHTVTAKRYGLHPSTVCDIRLNNRWA